MSSAIFLIIPFILPGAPNFRCCCFQWGLFFKTFGSSSRPSLPCLSWARHRRVEGSEAEGAGIPQFKTMNCPLLHPGWLHQPLGEVTRPCQCSHCKRPVTLTKQRFQKTAQVKSKTV